MYNAIYLICTGLQIMLTGYFIGDAVKQFKLNRYFVFGVDVTLAIYCIIGIASFKVM